jgi:hypothetical protein
MLNENIGQMLNILCYEEKLGIGNKNTFVQNARDEHPD